MAVLLLCRVMAAPAAAQSVGVTIDWQALDALPRAPAAAPRDAVKLHPPLAPKPAAAAVQPPAVRAPAPKLAALTPPGPPPARLAPGRLATVSFMKGETELLSSEKAQLDSLAPKLAADGTARVQLLSYASGTREDPLAARRLSLARAVAVRTYLIAKGVPGVRMDVRALGDKSEAGGSPDRVDLVVVGR